MSLVRIVSATRESESGFASTLLGQSLLAIPRALRPELNVRFENRGARLMGLPEVYNRAMDECPKGTVLVLCHDDVFIHDPFISQRVNDGLQQFDVLGLAGSCGGNLDEPSWALSFDEDCNPLGWQELGPSSYRSGFVSHCSPTYGPVGGIPPIQLSIYGDCPQPCELLDGLFLALDPRRSVFNSPDGESCFDPRFSFHLYDMDFCRTMRRRGAELATWPILVSHGSAGNFVSPEWKAAAKVYREKWRSQTPRTGTGP